MTQPTRTPGQARRLAEQLQGTTARTLRQLALVAAADLEGDPDVAPSVLSWLRSDPDRVRALLSIAVSLAGQAGYSPDQLRGWALMAEPSRPRGWRP